MSASLPRFAEFTLTLRGRSHTQRRPLVMGILNVTPDSFSDGGLFVDPEVALHQARRLIAEGADILDIGGESTRPGADPVPAEVEVDRVVPIIEALRDEPVSLSVDTMKPEVAAAALEAGAHLVNDVTGARDPAMLEVTAAAEAAICLMHMRGTPATMQSHTDYEDLLGDIGAALSERIAAARAAGIATVIADPGIGFAKTAEQNLLLLRELGALHRLGAPLLVGPSRKSFIGAVTGQPASERVEGTIAACVLAALQGAHILRVHDVAQVSRALRVTEAIQNAG